MTWKTNTLRIWNIKRGHVEANMLANFMGMLWEEGEFLLDAIPDHPGTILAILIVAFFLLLLLKVTIFNMIFFSNANISNFKLNITVHFP